VIVPEGVLFGNTDAHVRLRRELLTEHVIEGVISLPGGVFQPYTGVKTSIVVFRKETRRDDKQSFSSSVTPRTEYVWFYEVEDDGYTLNAKRDPRPGSRNDLWDALVKFKAWIEGGSEGTQPNEKILMQPTFHAERWRHALLRDTADKLTSAGEAFAGQPETGMWDGRVWGIHELFPALPNDPKQAEEVIRAGAERDLHQLVIQTLAPIAHGFLELTFGSTVEETPGDAQLLEMWKRAARPVETDFKKLTRDLERFFEKEDSPSLPIWKDLVKRALADGQTDEIILGLLHEGRAPSMTQEDISERLAEVARDVAKLDGFDVTLRSLSVDQKTEILAAKHWVVPVRAWAQNDEWTSEDGRLVGSHDVNGTARPAYVEAMLSAGLYAKGELKEGILDPDCVEAREWNLSAGQYKPFDFTQLKSERTAAQMIGDLRTIEENMLVGLDNLLAMLEGRA
jgi:type I restriction enzyme M protein